MVKHSQRYVYSFITCTCIHTYIHDIVHCTCIIIMLISIILYSGKLWRALNLANQSSERIGEFHIWGPTHVAAAGVLAYDISKYWWVLNLKFTHTHTHTHTHTNYFPPNHQIKTLAKVCRYTVRTIIIIHTCTMYMYMYVHRYIYIVHNIPMILSTRLRVPSFADLIF